jgi:hypothetical protein
MATSWVSKYVLVGTNGMKTSLGFRQERDGATPDVDFTAALVAHNLLATALGNVTDANIYSSQLTSLVAGSSAKPAAADITDMAFVQVYLNDPAQLPKYHNLRIPAPIVSMFNADLITVDKTDADLIAFVGVLSDDFVVSDNEVINTTVDDGVAGGFWASVKKSSR